ncbi:MAG: MATE family efflux transporter [Enterocloster clostridioformis]
MPITRRILCNMGIPMGLQYSITATGSVILQTAVNSLGSMAVAAVTAGSKISMFFCCPFDALGSTMATYGGQNVGARKLDRIDQGLKAGAVMGCVYAVIAFAVLCIFGQWIAPCSWIRGRGNPRNTRLFLIGNSLFYIPLVFVNAVRFMIQGLGYSRLAIIAGVCEMAARSFVGSAWSLCLVTLAVVHRQPHGLIAADLFLIPAYRHVMKNLNQLFYGREQGHRRCTMIVKVNKKSCGGNR